MIVAADVRPNDPLESGLPFMTAGVLLRKRRGEFKVLLMETEKKYGVDAGVKLWKFPGGMQEHSDNANPLRTLDRELFEETGFYLRPNHRVDPPVLQRERTRWKGGALHFRYFYLLWRNDVRGGLRAGIKEDVSSILYVPDWKNFAFVEDHLCRSQRGVLYRLRQHML